MSIAAGVVIPAGGEGRRMGGVRKAFMLLNDKPLLGCVALWAAAVAFIIYG